MATLECVTLGGIEDELGATGRSARTPAGLERDAAPETMAILRNIIVVLFQRLKHNSAAATTRYYVCHPQKSLEVLSTPN